MQLLRPFPRILALEIEERIIDELQDSVTSLRCCALVCRAWYIRSRRNRVRRITVNTVGDCDRLCTCFHTHPGLGSLVSVLQIWPERNSSQDPDIVWIPLAFQLPQLRTLYLSGGGWSDTSRHISFHAATLTGIRYSHSSLKTLKLHFITLRSPQDLLRLLTALPLLRTLNLRSLRFVDVNQESARRAIMRGSQKVNVTVLIVSVCRPIDTIRH